MGAHIGVVVIGVQIAILLVVIISIGMAKCIRFFITSVIISETGIVICSADAIIGGIVRP